MKQRFCSKNYQGSGINWIYCTQIGEKYNPRDYHQKILTVMIIAELLILIRRISKEINKILLILFCYLDT